MIYRYSPLQLQYSKALHTHCLSGSESLCRRPHELPSGVKVTTESGETLHVEAAYYGRSQSVGLARHTPTFPVSSRQHRSKTNPSTAPSLEHALGQSHEEAHKQAGPARKRKGKVFKAKSKEISPEAGAKTTSGTKSQPSASAHSKLIDSGDFMKLSMSEFRHEESSDLPEVEGSEWGFRPLLLFIPLRLGQDKFNPEYTEALKVRASSSASCSSQDCSPTHSSLPSTRPRPVSLCHSRWGS